jgi:hypothetical protein
VIPNQIPLDTLNGVALAGLQREWQMATERYRPNQEPDIADPNLFDHALWYTVTNFTKTFRGERRLLYPQRGTPKRHEGWGRPLSVWLEP